MDLSVLRHLGIVDIIIGFVLLGGVTLGLAQGVIRQVFFLASVYFGMVLSAQYYQLAGRGLALIIPGGTIRGYSVVGLLLVFVVVVVIINSLCYLCYRHTGLPLVARLERVAGAGLGLLSAWLFASLLVTAADFGLSLPVAGLESAQSVALRMMSNSLLVPTLHQSMPALFETIRPWVPAGLPAPFSV